MELHIVIFWVILVLLVTTENKEAFGQVENVKDKIIIAVIFAVGAPIFVCHAILEDLLNCILPEDDSNDERKL